MAKGIIHITEADFIAAANKDLRNRFDLWIVHDRAGWHEMMSLDYFDTWTEAYVDAVEYGKNIASGIKNIRYYGDED